MEQEQKPDWNRLDNIWEIMQSYHGIKQFVLEIFERRRKKVEFRQAGRFRFYRSGEDFVQIIAHLRGIRLPVYKIVIPDIQNLDIVGDSYRFTPMEGAIYYMVEEPSEGILVRPIHLFRGTFGYGGTGPHESALVEYALTKVRKCCFDVRDADCLLSMME